MSAKETTVETKSPDKNAITAICMIGQSYLKHGSPKFIFESQDSNSMNCRSLSRGNVCDIGHIDTSDCSEDTPLHEAIRLLRMLNFYSDGE